MRRSALFGALILTLVTAPTAAWSEDPNAGLTNEAGMGALAALSTLIYGPVKLTYATLGMLVGGIAWGLAGGDQEVLDPVITASVRGDYVVTPEHIRMERGLEFFGKEPQYRQVQQATAVSAGGFVEEDY